MEGIVDLEKQRGRFLDTLDDLAVWQADVRSLETKNKRLIAERDEARRGCGSLVIELNEARRAAEGWRNFAEEIRTAVCGMGDEEWPLSSR